MLLLLVELVQDVVDFSDIVVSDTLELGGSHGRFLRAFSFFSGVLCNPRLKMPNLKRSRDLTYIPSHYRDFN